MNPIAEREIRNLTTPIRLLTKGAPEATERGMLVGYASLFNEPCRPFFDWPEFVEIVHPDAFTRTLREMPDVRALRNHDPNLVLGRVGNRTVRLKPDAKGLGFEVDLNLKTTLGRDTQADVDREDIDGCSIGFMVVKDQVVKNEKTGEVTRTLLDVDLFEITPACTFPANGVKGVSLRSRLAGGSYPRVSLARRQLVVLDLGAK